MEKKIIISMAVLILILIGFLIVLMIGNKVENKSNLWDVCLEQTIDDPSMTEDYYEIYQPAINKSLKFRRIK